MEIEAEKLGVVLMNGKPLYLNIQIAENHHSLLSSKFFPRKFHSWVKSLEAMMHNFAL